MLHPYKSKTFQAWSRDWVLEVTQLRGCGHLACASAKPNANISGMNLLVPRAALRPLPTSYKRKSALGVFNLAENGTIYGYQNMGVYFSF
jgi:hypothetical protein